MLKNLILVTTLLLSFKSMSDEPKLKEITLTSDNTINFNSVFTDEAVTEAEVALKKLDSTLPSGYPIFMALYTPGGSITAGLDLYTFIKSINRPVHTITLFAASMGFQTVQQLGQRYITSTGILMAHKAKGGFEGEFGSGTSQVDSRYGLWLRLVEELDQQAIKRSGGHYNTETFRAAVTPELWLNGKEAVKVGLADEVAIVKCDNGLMNSFVVKQAATLFGNVTVRFSGCPLITSPISIGFDILTNQGVMDYKDFLVKGGRLAAKEDEKEKKVSSYETTKFDSCRLAPTTVMKPTNSGYGSSIYDDGVSPELTQPSNSVIPAELCSVNPAANLVDIQKAIEDTRKKFAIKPENQDIAKINAIKL